MNEIKDYVFYMLLKSDNKLLEEGNTYGIKKGLRNDHDSYFRSFINNDPFICMNSTIYPDWNSTMISLASEGNLIIVNSAVEITDDQFYLLYLPSNPSLFQLNKLEQISNELSYFDVIICGSMENIFNEIRSNKDFDNKKFLNDYIKTYKKRLSKNKVLVKY